MWRSFSLNRGIVSKIDNTLTLFWELNYVLSQSSCSFVVCFSYWTANINQAHSVSIILDYSIFNVCYSKQVHLSKLYSHANWAGECLLSRKLKSCDNIPPAMSCITDNDNFTAVCTNPAVIETAFNQYLENEGPIDDEPLNEYVYMYKLL